MRSLIRRSTISTHPSIDIKNPFTQQGNPQDKKIQSFLYRKGSINLPISPSIFNNDETVRNNSKEKKQKKSKQKLSKDEFTKNNIHIYVEQNHNIDKKKKMQEMSHKEIQEKYERDPFMRAKIQSFVRQNSASKRKFNTYKDFSKNKVPKTLKEKLDINDFQFYTKYAKIRSNMGVQ